MKPLSQMTRRDLYACDEFGIEELCKTHKVEIITTSQNPLNGMNSYSFRGWSPIMAELEHLRLELQQDKAAK